MPEITLYLANGACSLAAHLLLEEIGIPYTAVVMKWDKSGLAAADGSINADEYRRTIHHASQVPALKVDNEVITENPAILTFISTLSPGRNLTGKTALENARVAEWLAWISGTLHETAFGMMFHSGRYSDNESEHAHIQEKGRQRVLAAYRTIEKALEKKGFPVGEAETLVDYFTVPFWHWGDKFGIGLTSFPNYTRLVKRIEAKESAKCVLQAESVEPAL
ncbi:unnamed protein product [Clonostachys rosea]|uniref:GST N-terminal domain-containing protein n=1 Tax=Bionectria ochroleuca TaxID=29856 RepID=A0ABY6UM03_BIOOC|nr:unnamed protein product [Clonostachys rosea]